MKKELFKSNNRKPEDIIRDMRNIAKPYIANNLLGLEYHAEWNKKHKKQLVVGSWRER